MIPPSLTRKPTVSRLESTSDEDKLSQVDPNMLAFEKGVSEIHPATFFNG